VIGSSDNGHHAVNDTREPGFQIDRGMKNN
jgi:hypothetical protein